jgi:hypothetical protein
MEHEFKRLAEDADRRFEALKSEYGNISLKYNEMMIRLSDLTYANDITVSENSALRRQLIEYQSENTENNRKSGKTKTGSITKEKNVLNPRNLSNEFIKMHSNNINKATSGNSSICIAFDKLAINPLAKSKRHTKNSTLRR